MKKLFFIFIGYILLLFAGHAGESYTKFQLENRELSSFEISPPETRLLKSFHLPENLQDPRIFPGETSVVLVYTKNGKTFGAHYNKFLMRIAEREIPGQNIRVKTKENRTALYRETRAGKNFLELTDTRLHSISSYDFTGLQLLDFQHVADGVVCSYYDPGHKTYWIGSFNNRMAFKGQWEYSNLKVEAFDISNKLLAVQYKNTEGRTYLGTFDPDYTFRADLSFEGYPLKAFKVLEDSVIALYTEGKTSYVARYNRDMQLLGKTPFKDNWTGQLLAAANGEMTLFFEDKNNLPGMIRYSAEMKVLKKELPPVPVSRPQTTGIGPIDFPYDPGARYLTSGTKNMGTYYLFYNERQVTFKLRGGPAGVAANYNLKYQFWQSIRKDFDKSKVDLESLFLKIDTTKTVLDRMTPEVFSFQGGLKYEGAPYDYTKDKGLMDFLDYCKTHGASKKTIEFYIRTAANPAKRGALLPKGTYQNMIIYTTGELGIQPESMKPISYKNKDYDRKNNINKMTGGMEYFFSLNKGEYIRTADAGYNGFKDNNPVPLTIVEITPPDGFITPGILTGDALVKRVNENMTQYFKKDFKVSLVKTKMNYNKIYDNPKGYPPIYFIETVLQEFYDTLVPKNSLVIFYFTNRKGLAQFDPEISHPINRGVYASAWAANTSHIMHEFGHAIGLRHHFYQQEPFKDSSHISPKCIMNYKGTFKKEEICLLCRYGLGIE